MPRSGNPAKRAEELKISQVGDFKKRMGGIMELPSGSVVKLKNPGGMQAFLSADIIPNELMGIIQASLKKGTAPKPEQITQAMGLDKIEEDPTLMLAKLDEMTLMMDAIALKCIVEPPVLPVPENEADRDDDLLYIDEFPLEDKNFIFQWVSGGTRDLATFRQEFGTSMAAVAAVTESAGNAE